MKTELSLEGIFDDGENRIAAQVKITPDGETGHRPESWIWMLFALERDGSNEPWIKLTYKEAESIKNSLEACLERWIELGRPDVV